MWQPDGYRVVLFVVLVTPSGGAEALSIEASVTGGGTVDPEVDSLLPGQVGEITMITDPADAGTTVTLELTAERGSIRVSRSLDVEVVEWDDTIRPQAIDLRERFVSYLEAACRDRSVRAAIPEDEATAGSSLTCRHPWNAERLVARGRRCRTRHPADPR